MENPIDRNLKEQINKEGWEDNASVIIGKEGEEIDNLKERLESDNKCIDAATYIRLNKIICVPTNEIDPDFKKSITVGDGWIINNKLIYIDKEKNIVKVVIDFNNISSISEKNRQFLKEEVADFIEELNPYGFRVDEYSDDITEYEKINKVIDNYRLKVTENTIEQKDKEFDF